jgi:hypothetical protein
LRSTWQNFTIELVSYIIVISLNLRFQLLNKQLLNAMQARNLKTKTNFNFCFHALNSYLYHTKSFQVYKSNKSNHCWRI